MKKFDTVDMDERKDTEKIYLPHMLLIGATNRNVGKTTLASAIINKFKHHYPITGLKITAITEGNHGCPRGVKGCNVCASLKGDYDFAEEKNSAKPKDTSLLLASGAEKVFWLKVRRSRLYEGIMFAMKNIEKDTLIVSESNSARSVVVPGVFLMIDNSRESVEIKETARNVMAYSDMIIPYKDMLEDIDGFIDCIRVREENKSFHFFAVKH